MSLPTRTVAACGAAALLLVVSACGNKDDADPSASGGSYQQGGPQDQQGAADNPMPGANGKVAAVDGSTAQVQGADGQVAVSWDASTTFTKDVDATLADVSVGSCVVVGPSGEPSSSSTPVTEVTAASVRITPRTDGSCGLGLRGPGGPGGTGSTGEGPQLNGTPPSDAPDGAQRPQIRAMAGAIGEVTAVSATGFTVDSVMPGSSDGDKTSVTVTVDGSTTYTTTAAGAGADVKVGVCLAATGTTDQTGAVTAKTVNLSQPVDGQCGGMVRFKSGDGADTKAS
jgi:hypothetical protein